jgi:hypothetical protein
VSAAPCKRCGQRPKKLPQHFCDICLEVKLPPSQQAALALRRTALWTGVNPPATVIADRKIHHGEQWCRGCGTYRVIDIPALSPLMNTPIHIKMHVAPGASRCRACIAVQRREAIYGLTPQQQSDLLAVQGGKCALCGRDQKMRALAVEHNHDTNVVRGFGCKSCNHDLLGSLHDSPKMALRALVYLINPPARQVGIGEPPLTHLEVLAAITELYEEVFPE